MSEAVVDALVQLLSAEHEDFEVRAWATDALGRIGSVAAVDAVVLRLADEDHNVRTNAAYVLGRIGSENAIDALVLSLADENEDMLVRRYVEEAWAGSGRRQRLMRSCGAWPTRTTG